MLSNKRTAVDIESPDVANFKRRRFFGEDTENTYRGDVLANMDVNQNNNPSPGFMVNKRRRDQDGFHGVQQEPHNMNEEVERLKSQALIKIRELELINENLRSACEEQQKELVTKNNENRLLKRSVVLLNTKREEVSLENERLKQMVMEQRDRITQMEQAFYNLCAQHQAVGGCRRDDFSGFQGGGPVF